MKHVILVAMIEPYDGDIGDAEVWGVNRTYAHQENLSRVFFFDCLEHFPEQFVGELNDLAIPVLSRKHYDEIPLSEAYPIQEVIDYYGGHKYFTCTIAYMLALAIMEGYEKITLHGMYHTLDSHEYWHHKACIEYWVGVASGKGCEIEISGGTNICKPYVWQSAMYGYVGQRNELLAIQTMGAAYRGSIGYPISFAAAEEEYQVWADEDTERISGKQPEEEIEEAPAPFVATLA